MTFTKGRSERFNMKGGEKNLLLGFFFIFFFLHVPLTELAARPVLQEVVFPCRLCNTIGAELRKSGRVGDVFAFLTITTQPVKNFTRKKHKTFQAEMCFRFLPPGGGVGSGTASGPSAAEALRNSNGAG